MLTPKNAVPEEKLTNNLLVSDPALRDGCFDKSVVFMIEHHQDEGSLGVILNHPTGKTVKDLISSDAFSKLANLPVYHGGPVASDQLHFICFSAHKSGIRCQYPLSAEMATNAISKSGKLVRAFVGHSSWAEGQLHEELEKHAWFTAFSSMLTLSSSDDENLWAATLRELSPFHHIISLTPDNPFLN
ncbi:YqgE/AlgH family protein [Rubritalea tangerina]|uniref:YqgE/AlgH family protein n=2 Tax=Rubritalea tangerina TaxID=430798 RepID=A0ABW4Z8Y1_9BACT